MSHVCALAYTGAGAPERKPRTWLSCVWDIQIASGYFFIVLSLSVHTWAQSHHIVVLLPCTINRLLLEWYVFDAFVFARVPMKCSCNSTSFFHYCGA